MFKTLLGPIIDLLQGNLPCSLSNNNILSPKKHKKDSVVVKASRTYATYKSKNWKVFERSNEGREYFYPDIASASTLPRTNLSSLNLRKKGRKETRERIEERFCCSMVDSKKCGYEMKLVTIRETSECIIEETELQHTCGCAYKVNNIKNDLIEKAILAGFSGPKNIQDSIRDSLDKDATLSTDIIPSLKQIKNYKAYHYERANTLYLYSEQLGYWC